MKLSKGYGKAPDIAIGWIGKCPLSDLPPAGACRL